MCSSCCRILWQWRNLRETVSQLPDSKTGDRLFRKTFTYQGMPIPVCGRGRGFNLADLPLPRARSGLLAQVFGQDHDQLAVDLAFNLFGIVFHNPDILYYGAHSGVERAAFYV